VNIRASLNWGLSDELKAAFSSVIPVSRPLITDQQILDPNWLAGFTTAEGCFLINTYKSNTKTGVSATLRFQLTQHNRDEALMRSLIEYLGCGGYYFRSGHEVGDYRVSKFLDLTDKVIPFFLKYPILGVKAEDFKNFCVVAALIKDNKHLTKQGLEQIQKIKLGTNKGRFLKCIS